MKKMIYEFITPSDTITFKAENDKVAFVCAVLLGKGQAGCIRFEKGQEVTIPSMMFGVQDINVAIELYLETSLDEFIQENKKSIKNAFASFAYGSIEERQTFDDAIESITDEEKLNDFKAKHEDRNRTSLSGWVAYAWELGSNIK